MKLTPGLGFSRQASVLQIPDITGIANLAAWYDAADTATFVQTGGAVSQWTDKSGSGNHAIETNSSKRPITGTRTLNGRNVLDFNGSSHVMALPSGLYSISNGPHTIFMVCALDNTTSEQFPFVGVGYMGFDFNKAGANSLSFISNTDTSQFPALSKTLNTNGHILALRKNANNVTGWYDGTPSVNGIAADFTATGLYLSGRTEIPDQPLDGIIAEVLIYARTLTAAETNQVGNYLAAKWGVAWNGTSVAGSPFPDVSTIVAFGDSVTAGRDASSQYNAWTYKFGQSLNAGVLNKGIGGTVLQNSNYASSGAPATNNGRDRYVADLTGANKREFCIINYGLNDQGLVGMGGPGITLANFSNDYQEILTGLLAAGYDNNHICICSPYWVPDAYYSDPQFSGSSRAQHEQFVAAVRALAIANNVFYFDAYAYMRDHGGASLVGSDNIHPNDTGHAVIATGCIGTAAKVTS